MQEKNEEVEPVAGPSNPTPIAENINEYELSDSDSEADIAIYDDSLPIVENINEYTFDSDWESENDVNESLALARKDTTNPALAYMLEYSGLSQNQIMHFIKNKKSDTDKNHKTASKSIKAVAKNIFKEFAEVTKPTDDESMLTLPDNCEKVLESQSIKDVRSAKESMAIESIPSSPESDDLAEVEPLKDNTETLNIITSDVSSSEGIIFEECSPVAKSNDVTQIDTSDSDTDDFIEIQDVPIHDMNISKNIMKKKDIEITFRSNKKPEDDIFADIFENKEGVSVMSPKQIHFADTANGEDRAQFISENSNNLKDNILDTIPEEPSKEETKTELSEIIQLNENMSNDEDKILDTTQSSDKLIERDNVDIPTQVSPPHECTQEKPAVLPINKEDLTELKVNSPLFL